MGGVVGKEENSEREPLHIARDCSLLPYTQRKSGNKIFCSGTYVRPTFFNIQTKPSSNRTIPFLKALIFSAPNLPCHFLKPINMSFP